MAVGACKAVKNRFCVRMSVAMAMTVTMCVAVWVAMAMIVAMCVAVWVAVLPVIVAMRMLCLIMRVFMLAHNLISAKSMFVQ